jgi:hypothetical protein
MYKLKSYLIEVENRIVVTRTWKGVKVNGWEGEEEGG